MGEESEVAGSRAHRAPKALEGDETMLSPGSKPAPGGAEQDSDAF